MAPAGGRSMLKPPGAAKGGMGGAGIAGGPEAGGCLNGT